MISDGEISPREQPSLPLRHRLFRGQLWRLEQSLDYFYPLKDRGKKEMQSKRIVIRTGILDANQGPFQDLKALKKSLLSAG